ncbi:dihydroorotase, partial [Vibrio sp.]|nr:dihydroorotase [Vibrio sp.]
MRETLIRGATLVNEGKSFIADVRIKDGFIDAIAPFIPPNRNDQIIEADGLYLLPGMIDDQVHFREPGLIHKGRIASESKAAVAGGITSYMEMPSVNPSTTTNRALQQKINIAASSSLANYSFYLGATEDNLEQIKSVNPRTVCGIKV